MHKRDLDSAEVEGWHEGFPTPIPTEVRRGNSTCFAYHAAAQQLLSQSLPSQWRRHLPFSLLGHHSILSLSLQKGLPDSHYIIPAW